MTIDLRSDTLTKPTQGMLDAMMSAKVGDDVYKEDPTVNELEERIADMFGKPKALFFPTGTMANQTAIKLHTNPGDQVICDSNAHIEAINPPDFYHSPLTALVEIENTANRGGGSCWDFEELKKIRTVCNEHELGYHLDGARIWNALVAKPETGKDYGQIFDTMSVCLSKGLGCPIGSVLVGDEDIMENAIRIRKILGGGMRQVGFLAAAGLYALDNHIDRLAEDHQKAKEIGQELFALDFIKRVEQVETNIIIFELENKADESKFLKTLADKNIRLSGMGNGKLRIVTHLDYTNDMHEYFLNELKGLKF